MEWHGGRNYVQEEEKAEEERREKALLRVWVISKSH